MQTEPRYLTHTHYIADLEFTFTGEAWDERGFFDTAVRCNGQFFCWISWPDKEVFANELNAIISKYRI